MAQTLTEVSNKVIRDAGFSSASLCPWYYNAGAAGDGKLIKIYDKIREADRVLRQWFRNHAADEMLLEHSTQVIPATSPFLLFDPWDDVETLHAGVTKSKIGARITKYTCGAGITVGEYLLIAMFPRPVNLAVGDTIAMTLNCSALAVAGSFGVRFAMRDGTLIPTSPISLPELAAGTDVQVSVPFTTAASDVIGMSIAYVVAVGGGSFTLNLNNITISSRTSAECKLSTVPGNLPQNPGRLVYAEDSNGNEVQVVNFRQMPLLNLAAYKLAAGIVQPNTQQARCNYRLIFTRPGYVMLRPAQSESKTITFYYIGAGGEYSAGTDIVNGPDWYVDLLVRQAIVLLYNMIGRPADVYQTALDARLIEYLHDKGYGDNESEIICDEPF